MNFSASNQLGIQAPVLAVSSWSWHAPFYSGSFSLLDLPARASALGIEWVELNDFMLPPPRFSRIRRPLWTLLPTSHREGWRYSRETLELLAGQLAAHRVQAIGWTVETDLTVGPLGWWGERLYFERALAACRILGVSHLRITLERHAPHNSMDQSASMKAESDRAEIDRAEIDRQVIERLAFLARRVEPTLTLLVENHGGMSSDPDRLLRLLTAARKRLSPTRPSSSQLGFCFDPGNLAPGLTHEAKRTCWTLLAKGADALHLKIRSFDQRGEEPEIAYGFIARLLRENGFSGPVVLEYEGDKKPKEAIPQGIDLFRRHFITGSG